MRKNVGYSVIVYDDNNKSCETVIVSSCRGLNGDRFQQYEQYCTAVKAGKWSFTMTYVEFFDKIASENISACLTYVPDRVIYIGDDYKVMNKHIVNYNKVFSERGYNIEFIAKSVSKSNLENAVKLLSEIVEAYDDCVFDITGGEEILNLALGVVYSKYPDKNIQIHKFNLRNNAIYDCDKDGKTIYKETPTLSIDENIRISGTTVLGDKIIASFKTASSGAGIEEIVWKAKKDNSADLSFTAKNLALDEVSGEYDDVPICCIVTLWDAGGRFVKAYADSFTLGEAEKIHSMNIEKGALYNAEIYFASSFDVPQIYKVANFAK